MIKADQSPVLRTVARWAVPLTALVSLVIFFQGHNKPGGGFIAGVLVAVAGAIHLLAFGVEKASKFAWWKLSMVGLLIAVGTGVVLMFTSESGTFMDHSIINLPFRIHLPTATFFDVGVYLIVLGTLMTIFVELGRE